MEDHVLYDDNPVSKPVYYNLPWCGMHRYFRFFFIMCLFGHIWMHLGLFPETYSALIISGMSITHDMPLDYLYRFVINRTFPHLTNIYRIFGRPLGPISQLNRQQVHMHAIIGLCGRYYGCKIILMMIHLLTGQRVNKHSHSLTHHYACARALNDLCQMWGISGGHVSAQCIWTYLESSTLVFILQSSSI